ncbi:MAG: hypothetical protein FWG61_09570 [Firmicutes bacterium]|nr:hypothetical protein [Bacillota bacterium]
MSANKRSFKDRRDGTYVGDLDGMHVIMAHLLPRRTACETFLSEQIDITKILAYLEQKNSASAIKYTLFHVVTAAAAKMLVLRPKLNRFISGRRYYQRQEVSLAFVVKRQFSDGGDEGLLVLPYPAEGTLDSLAEQVVAEANKNRKGEIGESMDAVNTLAHLPRFLLAFIVFILRILDFYGKVPGFLTSGDPNYATLFVSNLGSIKLNAGYHHLNDWGTNSLFLTVGEKHLATFYNNEGEPELRPALNIGFTLDERLADGYYYSRSLKLFKYLLQHPQLLELPAQEEVSYDN